MIQPVAKIRTEKWRFEKGSRANWSLSGRSLFDRTAIYTLGSWAVQVNKTPRGEGRGERGISRGGERTFPKLERPGETRGANKQGSTQVAGEDGNGSRNKLGLPRTEKRHWGKTVGGGVDKRWASFAADKKKYGRRGGTRGVSQTGGKKANAHQKGLRLAEEDVGEHKNKAKKRRVDTV